MGSVAGQILILGVLFATLGVLSDGLYALAAGTVRTRIAPSPRGLRAERWFSGTVLVGLGVAAALTGRSDR